MILIPTINVIKESENICLIYFLDADLGQPNYSHYYSIIE